MKILVLFFLLLNSSICMAQIINIPDANFKNRLLTADTSNTSCACIGSSTDNCLPGVIDTNGDGEIEVAEAQTVAILDVGGSNISDLTGVEYFTNVDWLVCAFNHLTSVNVSQLSNLKKLQCQSNQITTLDLSNLYQLKLLSCSNNQLTSLDFSHQNQLEFVIASNNRISSFDFSANPALQRAYCDGNLMPSLDFSRNPAFFDLGCRNSPNLTSIKIRNNTTQLFGAATYYNQCWTNVPNLNYICADSNEIPALQSFLTGCGVTQAITIDSACPLAVEEFTATSFSVFPNPSQGIFTLNFTTPLSEKSIYSVCDMLGKQLLERELPEGTSSAVIDMENYPQGVYLLQMRLGESVVSKKLVKQ